MRRTTQLSITLPNDMAAFVRWAVESGDYASESEVIRDGLRSLAARDAAVKQWLRTEVAAAADALDADPETGISAADIREHFATKRSPAK